MRVLLAGYNVDSAVIEELKRHSPPREDATPETLSASYARISRDPRPVDELRAAARAEVDGPGGPTSPSSSRWATTRSPSTPSSTSTSSASAAWPSRRSSASGSSPSPRNRSATSRSARTSSCRTEVKRAGREALFVRTVRAQNALYHRLYARLKPHVFSKIRRGRGRSRQPRRPRRLGERGRPLCREPGDRRTAGDDGQRPQPRAPHPPLRGQGPRGGPGPQRPSLRAGPIGRPVHHPLHRPEPFDAETYPGLAAAAERWPGPRTAAGRRPGDAGVSLAGATPDGDSRTIAALLHTVTRLPYKECLAPSAATAAAGRAPRPRPPGLRTDGVLRFPPREFEHADLVFDLVVSASCFAQLKRHRMATLTWQRYDPRSASPCRRPSARPASRRNSWRSSPDRGRPRRARKGHRPRRRLRPDQRPPAASPAQAQRPRALPHLAPARGRLGPMGDPEDGGGDVPAGRQAMPLSCLLFGGKDAYPEIFAKVFGRAPKMVPPGSLNRRFSNSGKPSLRLCSGISSSSPAPGNQCGGFPRCAGPPSATVCGIRPPCRGEGVRITPPPQAWPPPPRPGPRRAERGRATTRLGRRRRRERQHAHEGHGEGRRPGRSGPPEGAMRVRVSERP